MVRIMKKINIVYLIICILLFLLTLTMIIPILNIVALSFSAADRVGEVGGFTIIPKGFSLMNYKVLLSNSKVVMSLFNAVFITVIGTLLNLLLTSISAYVLTRDNLKGKSIFMGILILVMVLDPGIVPEFLMIKKINLMGSYWSVILYKAVNVYYLIIMMRFFEDIPKSLVEASRVDGAGHLTILFKIFLPLAKAAMATIGLFYAVFHWNEYFRASIYLDQAKWPLQVVLRQFVVLNDTSSIVGVNSLLTYDEAARLNYDALQAGTIVVAIVPILLLYPLILKYYTKGTMEGGVKE